MKETYVASVGLKDKLWDGEHATGAHIVMEYTILEEYAPLVIILYLEGINQDDPGFYYLSTRVKVIHTKYISISFIRKWLKSIKKYQTQAELENFFEKIVKRLLTTDTDLTILYP